MPKIGFIDYFLDEWHANNYPEFFRTRSEGRYEVAYAYGQIDSPKGGMTSKAWAEHYGVELVDSIPELIEKSDCIVVLSPDNPEQHLQLTDLALKSGKRVYVDKTFAPDKATAAAIFANADAHNTPCYSSSALRFSAELDEVDTAKIHTLYSEGPGLFDIYCIHQIEPIVRLMDTPAKEVMFLGDRDHPAMVIRFADGRLAHMRQVLNADFKITAVNKENVGSEYVIRSDFFGLFIDGLIRFFDTGDLPVPHNHTLEVIAIREAGFKALERPFQWIPV